MKNQPSDFLRENVHKTLDLQKATIELNNQILRFMKQCAGEVFDNKIELKGKIINKAPEYLSIYAEGKITKLSSFEVRLGVCFQEDFRAGDHFGCYTYAGFNYKNKKKEALEGIVDGIKKILDKKFVNNYDIDECVEYEDGYIYIYYGDDYESGKITRPQTLEAIENDLISLGKEVIRIIDKLKKLLK